MIRAAPSPKRAHRTYKGKHPALQCAERQTHSFADLIKVAEHLEIPKLNTAEFVGMLLQDELDKRNEEKEAAVALLQAQSSGGRSAPQR